MTIKKNKHASVKGGYYSADESYKATATLANRTGDLETLLIFTHRDGHETATHGSGADIEGRERGQADPFDIALKAGLSIPFLRPLGYTKRHA
ncbi:hypothetical protein K6Q96_20480 [Grimontia kaedaensis]|uniref:Uncharacterized protein n=1 Tax=Grimontia kaedaensis TaxID=2872157 RepID=A0ABY4X2S2_9GAMM|nr:hypothetical protein [Grimontia kaedaensis]USH05574.1 hypothetical protein K6Q96_20480 [Grimontia kaedaensis]